MTIPFTGNSSATTTVESDWSLDKGGFGGQDKHRITIQDDGKLTLSLVHQTFFDILMEKMFGAKHKETVTHVKDFDVHQLDEKQKNAFSRIAKDAKGKEKTFCEFEEKAIKTILISLKDKTGEIKTDDLERRITDQVNKLNEDITTISSRVLTSKAASPKKDENPKPVPDVDNPLPLSEGEQQRDVSLVDKKTALPLEELPQENEEFFDAISTQEDAHPEFFSDAEGEEQGKLPEKDDVFFEVENSEPFIQEVESQREEKSEPVATHKPKSLKSRVKNEKDTKNEEGRPGLFKTVAVCALLFTGGLFTAQRSNISLFNGGPQPELDVSPEALSRHKTNVTPPVFTNLSNMTTLVDSSIFERSISGAVNDTSLVELPYVEFPYTATNWSAILSPDFDIDSFTSPTPPLNTTSFDRLPGSTAPLPTSSLNTTSSDRLPGSAPPLPTSPLIASSSYPLPNLTPPLPTSPLNATSSDRLPGSTPPLPTSPLNATSSDRLPGSTSPLPTSPLNASLSDSLPTSPLETTLSRPSSTSTTKTLAVGLAGAVAGIALIRFGKTKKDMLAGLSKEIDRQLNIAKDNGELLENDVTDIKGKIARLSLLTSEAELIYQQTALILEINERRLNNLRLTVDFKGLDGLAMEMIALEEKLQSSTQNAQLLSKCEALKKDCINAVQRAMLERVQNFAQEYDGKKDVEDMDAGRKLDVTMTKIYSSVYKRKFIEVPAQVRTDIYRQCVIINGTRLHAKEGSKEPANFQICKQLVDLLGANGVDKFRGIVHQSILAAFMASFQAKEGVLIKPLTIAGLKDKVDEELFNKINKKFPQLLDPEFIINVNEDGSVDFTYSAICEVKHYERFLDNPDGDDPIYGETLCRLNFSFSITKENYQQPRRVIIENAKVTVSDLVQGFENIEQLKSPDAQRIQERREVSPKLKKSYEAKFKSLTEEIETSAKYWMFKTYWNRESVELNNLYDDHRLDGKGLEAAVNAKIKQMQDCLRVYEKTAGRFAQLKAQTSDTVKGKPNARYALLMDALTREYNDLDQVYENEIHTTKEINEKIEMKMQEIEDRLKLFDESDRLIFLIETELKKMDSKITVTKEKKEKMEKTFKSLVIKWENGPYTLTDLKKLKEELENFKKEALPPKK